jgi:opacity protein-like surface antigen
MKNLITATVLALSLSSAAQAQDMFAFMGDQDEGTSVIIINPLNATSDGYVAVYDYRTGTPGKLLGVASVVEGANAELRVQVGHTVNSDVIAYLFAGDDFTDPSTALDSVEIDIE